MNPEGSTSLEQIELGSGGYGTVRGPSLTSIADHIKRHGCIRKSLLRARKTYTRGARERDRAVGLDQYISSIDPSREYLRGVILGKHGQASVEMVHQGESLYRYRGDMAAVRDEAYQLVISLYILYRGGMVHNDIKESNIVVDGHSPTGNVVRMGLIDFDLATIDSHSKADRFNGVWPIEMYVHCTGRGEKVFCTFPSKPVGRRRSKCTDEILSIWYEQWRIISRLIPDEKEKMKLYNVGCAAIIHYNYPDISLLQKKKEEAVFVHGYNPTQKTLQHFQKTKMFYDWKVLGEAMTPQYSADPIVREYIRVFFGDSVCAYDWRKIDPFGLGLVFIGMFAEGAGGRLRDCLFRMVHPDPSRRHNAPTLLQEWLEVLFENGDKLLLRRVLRELATVLSAQQQHRVVRVPLEKTVRFRTRSLG